jgi:hypothetical protein
VTALVEYLICLRLQEPAGTLPPGQGGDRVHALLTEIEDVAVEQEIVSRRVVGEPDRPPLRPAGGHHGAQVGAGSKRGGMSKRDPHAWRPAYDATISLSTRHIEVRYRVYAGRDPALRAGLALAEDLLQAGAKRQAEALYRQLAVRAIEAWDLLSHDRHPAPITEAMLAPVPLGALQRIIREAMA